MKRQLTILIPLTLAACGSANTPAERNADQLEKAAAQSDPVSANVLKNAAEKIRATGDTQAPSTPGSQTQRALESAANQSSSASTAPTQAPEPRQAAPHKAGDPVPGTKTTPQR